MGALRPTRWAAPIVGALTAAAASAGCPTGDLDAFCTPDDPRPLCGSTPGDPVARIDVTPPVTAFDVDLDRQRAQRTCFRAVARHRSGLAADVTATAIWTLDRPELGSFDGPCLTTSDGLRSGGSAKVQASLADGVQGSAALRIHLHGLRENDGVRIGEFAGPRASDPDARPRLVYPLDGSLHPRNVVQMTVQFIAGAGNERFLARFVSSLLDYTVTFEPTACDGDRCQWQVPEDLWRLVASTNGGATAAMTLSGTGPGGKAAEADAIDIAFSPDDVVGGLYYFSPSLPGILRLPFSKGGTARTAVPFTPPGTPESGGQPCVGCHALAADGSKLAATYVGDDARATLGIASGADASTFSRPPGMVAGSMPSFSPDGTRIVAVDPAGALVLRDGNTLDELFRFGAAELGAGGRATMPEWSPDGTHIAFVGLGPDSTLTSGALASEAGDIAVVTRGADDTIWSRTEVLVSAEPGRLYHFQPTFSPDGQWIAFVSAGVAGTAVGAPPAGPAAWRYDAAPGAVLTSARSDARLRLVRATGGTPVELARAAGSAGSAPSWPRFTPFVQRGGRLLFVTFSSRLGYGLRVPPGARPQLFLAAIDTREADAGRDPSASPVWLPFQDPAAANVGATWTTKIQCDAGVHCGPGEFCQGGQCLPRLD